jgi:hypothetical protein
MMRKKLVGSCLDGAENMVSSKGKFGNMAEAEAVFLKY